MDLLPKPGQMVAASTNVAHKLLYGGVADLRPMPRTLMHQGPQGRLSHYRPMRTVKPAGNPVLLLGPLAAPTLCYDLRRGCSLVEHLLSRGRPAYLAEPGESPLRDAELDRELVERWVLEVVAEAVERVSKDAEGRPVHLLGWSLGGVVALLTAAAHPTLPVATVTTLGSPVDLSQVPAGDGRTPLAALRGGRGATAVTRTLEAPRTAVRRTLGRSPLQQLFTRPLTQLANLDDRELLAQVEAVARFTASMPPRPARRFGALYHRVLGDELGTGELQLGGHTVRLADVEVPVLAIAGTGDPVAPPASVRPLERLLPRAAELRLEVVPGGHLGVVTGRAARGTTWRAIDEFLNRHSGRQPRPSPGAPPIGANPSRRFGSASSRSLSATTSHRGRS